MKTPAFFVNVDFANADNSNAKAAQPSRAALREDFHKAVQAKMKELRISYQAAFNLVSKDHPFFANSADVKTVTFSNAAQRGAAIQAAVAKKTSVGVPYDAAFRSVEHERPELFVRAQAA